MARAITSLGLSPVMFELGARPHPPQELYRAYLAQSDIFVGLYWQSYGWVGPAWTSPASRTNSGWRVAPATAVPQGSGAGAGAAS